MFAGKFDFAGGVYFSYGSYNFRKIHKKTPVSESA